MRTLFVISLAALAAATPAHAMPRLEAGVGSALVGLRVPIGLGYQQAKTDPAPTRIVFRVPEAYSFTPTANGSAAGSVVGSDVVQISTRAEPLTGVLTLADPASFFGEGLACTGSGVHDAVWAVSVAGPNGAFELPIFVDGRTFTICPSAERLGGFPTAIDFQLGLIANAVDRPLVTGPTMPGTYVWGAIVTLPGLPDIEIRSLVDLPQIARVTAKVVRGTVRITGRVTANDRGIGGVRVSANIAKTRRTGFDVYGRTRVDGRFTIVHRLGRGTFFVRAGTYPDERDVTATGCATPSHATGVCVSATQIILGLAATPAAVRVRSAGVR